ncbi:DUF1672 family protein [Sporolactobacillus sp. Y61]|uniref:DUF1672 family protein n=1 Tax=Sporolactobacillus sp. Y61 TaxID=3160863 RepID=A0AAU8IFL1_9BACL
MNQTNDPNSITGENRNEQNENVFARVQDYTGQGYALEGGEETDKIAEAHRDEVVHAVEKFFREKYKTEVIVHNLVGNIDGVTVFVESVGEPHFYTYAIVPIDKSQKKINTDAVWSQEGKVEDAIRTGIYNMVFDDKFKNLDDYLTDFTSNNLVVGKKEDAIANVGGNGFSTPYYYMSISKDAFSEDILSKYLENPQMTKIEWKEEMKDIKLHPKEIYITLQLFMKEHNAQPNKEIFNKISSDIEKLKNIPSGAYSIYLHDNKIYRSSGIGNKENSLKRGTPNKIIK